MSTRETLEAIALLKQPQPSYPFVKNDGTTVMTFMSDTRERCDARDRLLAFVAEALASSAVQPEPPNKALLAALKKIGLLEPRGGYAPVEAAANAYLEAVAIADAAIVAIAQAEALPAPVQPEPARPWRLIETYPKDEAPQALLYGMRDFSDGIVQGCWNRGDMMVMEHWMGGVRRPTHWMPLPAPPSSDPSVPETTP